MAIPVNHLTGRPVPQGENGSILEFFIKGTEPKALEAAAPPGLSPRSAQAFPALPAGIPGNAPAAPSALPQPGDR
ncbi:MAG: hypothetical protein HYU32_04005 [candidate division NC10 bacterium]|nr:hypothetical protein [candidate division NC10 bacterium]